MKKVVAIASIPSRKDTLVKTIESLYPQVDLILVWLNGYDKVPLLNNDKVYFWLSSDNVGDVGKFMVVDKFKALTGDDFYLFTCDDDLHYPPDYIEHNINLFEPQTIHSSHGKKFPEIPLPQLISQHPSYYFGNFISKKEKIHLGGTGVMMMDSNVFKKLPYTQFTHQNMCDVWVAGFAHQNKIPIFILPHPQNWIKDLGSSQSIFGDTRNKDTIQTQILNHYLTN